MYAAHGAAQCWEQSLISTVALLLVFQESMVEETNTELDSELD